MSAVNTQPVSKTAAEKSPPKGVGFALYATLSAAFSHLEDSAIVLSPEGEIVVWNKGAEALFGHSFKDVRNKNISIIAPPGADGDPIEMFAQVLSGHPVAVREADRVRKDGTHVRVSVRVSPVEDHNGQIYGVLFVARDLTRDISREGHLNEVTERQDEIATLIPDALYIHRDGKLLWANPAAVEMFRASSVDDMVGRMAWEMIDREDLEKVLARHEKLGSAMASSSIFVKRTRFDGEVFPSEGRGAKITWENEPATLMVVRDLTDQERALSALAESEDRERSFAVTSPDAMLVHVEGEVVFANEIALQMFGAARPEEFVGQDISRFVHEDDRVVVRENWNKWDKWREGESVEPVEARRLRLDGSMFTGEGRIRSTMWEGKKAFLVAIRDVTERNATQQALAESEQQHRQLVDANPNAVLVVVECSIVFANKAAKEMLRETDGQRLVGCEAMELVPEEIRDDVLRVRSEVSDGQQPPLIESFRRRLDGSEFPTEVTATSYTWDGGPAILLLMSDVTDRVDVEEAHSALEERYRTMLDVSPLAVFVHVNGRFRYVNPAAVEMYGGTSAADLMGQETMDLVHPDERERVLKHNSGRKQGDMVFISDVRRLRIDGTEFSSVANGAVIEWEGEDGFMVIARDTTEEIATRQALDDTEDRQRQITEGSPDATFIHVDGEIKYANRAAVEMFGLTRTEDFNGRQMRDFVHPEDIDQNRNEKLWRPPAGEVSRLVVRRFSLDGTIFPTENTMCAYSWDGEPATMAVIRDISAQHEAEAKFQQYTAALEQTTQELERFTHVAAHDFKEPLRMVSSFCGLLQERYADDLEAQAQEYIGFAVDGAERMQSLVEDLLHVSQTSTAKPNLQPIDVGELLAEVTASLEGEIAESRAQLDYFQMPTINADHKLLGQVFQNLLSNAIKFRSDAAPVIEITAEIDGPNHVFAVSDNGIGIDPKNTEQVFDVFKTLHARHEFPGNGVGLTICRQIIERHGGQIQLESTLGEGARFEFPLPMTAEMES
jgi:PAS domain S-box-containing protein